MGYVKQSLIKLGCISPNTNQSLYYVSLLAQIPPIFAHQNRNDHPGKPIWGRIKAWQLAGIRK